MYIKLIKYVFIGLALSLLYSCRLHKELRRNKDKVLLNSISVKTEKYKQGENLYHPSTYLIEDYIKQKPNRRFLLNRWKPYTGLYLRSRDNFHTKRYKKRIVRKKIKAEKKYIRKKEKFKDNTYKLEQVENKRTKKLNELAKNDTLGTPLMLSLKEAPVWIDDSLTKSSIDQISLLMESKGYFNSEVSTIIKNKRLKKAQKITYKIKENRPHLIDKVNFSIKDSTIRKIIAQSNAGKTLKKGENYNVSQLSSERERIYNILKKQGYFDFQRQYINFKIDTLVKKYHANIDIKISNPAGNIAHTQYRINQVKVYIDKDSETLTDTVYYNGIKYFHNKNKYSKRVLDTEIALKKGELYSVDKAQFTRNNLGNLPIVKFINLNFIKKDSSNLLAIINIKTHKRFQLSSEIGANLNVSQGQSIPGPYVNVQFSDRKTFRGFESLEANANYTIQGQLSLTESDSIYRAREFGGNISLNFPKLLIPRALKESKLLKSKNPFANNIYKSTKLEIAYTNVSRQEFDRTNLGFDFKYGWQKGDFETFTFSPMTLNIVSTPFKTEAFEEFLNNQSSGNGINIKESFRSSIISNMNFGYLWSNIDLTRNDRATLVKGNVELGGLTGSVITKITNKDEILGLPFYKYIKLSGDLRKYQPLSKYSNLVFRVAGGYERPMFSSDVLPFEKYFFTGGVSSNRAWRARRIGPGTYNPSNAQDENFQRPGEILLEGNIEYRTKISGIFHTALFMDASNVWTNLDDDLRPGARFDATNLHRSLAIGGGLGLRLDFSLLIFRLDLGYPIYDPSIQSFRKFEPLNPLYNLGIGYPF